MRKKRNNREAMKKWPSRIKSRRRNKGQHEVQDDKRVPRDILKQSFSIQEIVVGKTSFKEAWNNFSWFYDLVFGHPKKTCSKLYFSDTQLLQHMVCQKIKKVVGQSSTIIRPTHAAHLPHNARALTHTRTRIAYGSWWYNTVTFVVSNTGQILCADCLCVFLLYLSKFEIPTIITK